MLPNSFVQLDHGLGSLPTGGLSGSGGKSSKIGGCFPERKRGPGKKVALDHSEIEKMLKPRLFNEALTPPAQNQ
jgi:hypothetical protein